MAKKEVQSVSVLAFEKKIIPSDGYMYGAKWDCPEYGLKPLEVREKSVRGTISNSLKDAVLNDPLKLSAEIEKANLQKVDCCFLNEGEDTLVVKFSVKFLGNLDVPSACSNEEFLTRYKKAVDEYKNDFGFEELSFRYAYNIASARFLWRNRLGADEIKVEVKDCSDGKTFEFDSKNYNIRMFDDKKKEELKEFSSRIADAFKGDGFALFEIICKSRIGKGQEVFPSEEMVLDKSDKDKSKILYSVDGCAAFHSQKIGNALRTIDTWYSDFGTEEGVGPIAIDSYGPVTTISKAFRKDKTNFYSIKDEYIWGDDELTEDKKHYFMAMIIRGGVFGESTK